MFDRIKKRLHRKRDAKKAAMKRMVDKAIADQEAYLSEALKQKETLRHLLTEARAMADKLPNNPQAIASVAKIEAHYLRAEEIVQSIRSTVRATKQVADIGEVVYH